MALSLRRCALGVYHLLFKLVEVPVLVDRCPLGVDYIHRRVVLVYSGELDHLRRDRGQPGIDVLYTAGQDAWVGIVVGDRLGATAKFRGIKTLLGQRADVLMVRPIGNDGLKVPIRLLDLNPLFVEHWTPFGPRSLQCRSTMDWPSRRLS